ncbi:uncharacterized protein BDZ83DRAFT_413972 [Colletotrichum acutatum]|uniref:Zn(2)-C6 fungal-type domain-containing protein n=1 Tax=Glomerella acutata TaxID=27357 RepID=A0AAD8UF12_GLOAC|nr:uncharacterized protein BDZ83DRAFT_413972 [Colletotrichum acutatum]KAK1722721.1 hypothetical protein BDZ83DRAFT_413972 [Colletotrichum acutatum]
MISCISTRKSRPGVYQCFELRTAVMNTKRGWFTYSKTPTANHDPDDISSPVSVSSAIPSIIFHSKLFHAMSSPTSVNTTDVGGRVYKRRPGACETCKVRKRKCDGGRPSCDKCLVSVLVP